MSTASGAVRSLDEASKAAVWYRASQYASSCCCTALTMLFVTLEQVAGSLRGTKDTFASTVSETARSVQKAVADAMSRTQHQQSQLELLHKLQGCMSLL